MKLHWEDYECTYKAALKESLYGKVEPLKRKKKQTKIKFKAEHADEKAASPRKMETSTPVKGEGFGLDLIAEKEYSPSKQRKVQKMDLLGQIGVKLFGFKSEQTESVQPNVAMKAERQRSLSPEKHPAFLTKQGEEEDTKSSFPNPSGGKMQYDPFRVSQPSNAYPKSPPTAAKEDEATHQSMSTVSQERPNITQPVSNSRSSDSLSVPPVLVVPIASTSKRNALSNVPSKELSRSPIRKEAAQQAPLNPVTGKLKDKFGPAEIKRFEGSDSTTIQGQCQSTRPSYAQHKSNPNASAAMKDANFRQARTSVSENFIEGYYQNSRLHYLSTWKSEMKNIVAEAHERAQQIAPLRRSQSSASQPEKAEKPKTWNFFNNKGKKKERERYYMHCDFDSFFVAVGLLDRPALKGKPVVVCHSQGETGGASSTSEIASASYEARAFGIKNGMRYSVANLRTQE